MFPSEVPYAEIETDPDPFIDAVFASLESEFLEMPKGQGFLEYAIFESAYETLKKATHGFSHMDAAAIYDTVVAQPVTLIVLRTMLGFTPPEWAYITSRETEVTVDQGAVRSLDRRVRIDPASPLPRTGLTAQRVRALVDTAVLLLTEGAPAVPSDRVHRLTKADTEHGLIGVQSAAQLGVPYAMLLYERFLGRPFAGHRDSVSDLIGNTLEGAIEGQLSAAGISYRRTRRAERLAGFEQAPDFIVPSEFCPAVVVESKITEDDGTARDKVARIWRLTQLSVGGQTSGQARFEVVACIGGRGFGVRRELMRSLLEATGGKVFTLQTLDRLVECTGLQAFRTR